MEIYDLAVAWNWEYDADFIELLSFELAKHNLSLLQIKPDNWEIIYKKLIDNQLRYLFYLDRASDVDSRFHPYIHWNRQNNVISINPYELSQLATDKALMHNIFIQQGINTPYTIILPPYHECPNLKEVDLTPLGGKFHIKPAHGGGGIGVKKEATTWEAVLEARKEFPHDSYLLQEHITPIILGHRPAWFRAIFCCDQIFPCWWDTRTHIYQPLLSDEEITYSLYPIREIVHKIFEICKLNLFSSEIVLTLRNGFVVVDYINDPIDLRAQSKAVDGIPDDILKNIVKLLVEFILKMKK